MVNLAASNGVSNKHEFLKDKVVVILGATGTGKTRISVQLALHFKGEIINSDKIQVYKGLDIASNKVTDEEACGVPHHLLGIVDPNEDFTAKDFVDRASREVDAIIQTGHLPIIAGGSNSFLRALLIDDAAFCSKYDVCLIWVDVSIALLCWRLSTRVDEMVELGLVEEVREFYEPNGDYSRGIRRAIGVPETDEYFRNERYMDNDSRANLLKMCTDRIKHNTYKLALQQLHNIFNLTRNLGLPVHRIDTTEVFMKTGEEAYKLWEKRVSGTTIEIIHNFLAT